MQQNGAVPYSTMELAQQVKNALLVIYGHSFSREEFKRAESWLEAFQASTQAWEVADILLSEEVATPETLFIAADTLRKKISYDIRELAPDKVVALRGKLVTHLATWSRRPGPLHPFLNRLCVVLATLAVQTNWHGVLTELINMMIANSVPNELVLELLGVLPEECHSDKVLVDDDVRESFRLHLLESAPQVLQFLSAMDITGPSRPENLQTRAFASMERWVHFFREVPATALVDNKLLGTAFVVVAGGAQESGQLFDAAVNLIMEVLHSYPCRPANIALVQFMVPRVMQLTPTYQRAAQQTEDDAETARGCCRVFTEMAQSYMGLLMAPEALQQEELAALVLNCTAHPDTAINSLTLDFWYDLTVALESIEDQALKEAKVRQFSGCFSSLVLVLVQLMRWPDDWESMERDQKEDVTDYRYKVGDTLREVCRVMGATYCVIQLASKLQEAVAVMAQSQGADLHWRDVEACLWAIRSIAGEVPVDEATAVPQILQIILQLPAHPTLRQTANHIIGHCARWLRGHPEMLNHLYAFLLNGFSTAETASSSAIAIRDICLSCGQVMGEPALALYDQLVTASQNKQIRFKDEMQVLEGLCNVVATLPFDAARAAEERMVVPVAEHMMKCVMEAQAGGSTDREVIRRTAMAVSDDLDRITVIVRNCEPRRRDGARKREGEVSPAVGTIQRLWPALEAVFSTFKADVDVMEKLCRMFKHALRAGREDFAPVLDALLGFFLGCFAESHVSSFLYALSICAAEFGGPRDANPVHQPKLVVMLEEASRLTLAFLRSQEDFECHPDVVEEFFYLVSRLLQQTPQLLLVNHQQHGLVSTVLQMGIVGLAVHHRDAQRGILHFLEALVKVGLDEPLALKPQVLEVMVPHGQALVQKVLDGLVGEMPAHLVDESGGSLAGLLWKLNKLCPEQLRQWVYAVLAQNISEQIAPVQDKSNFLESVCLQSDRGEFERIVAKFGRRCRQSKRRLREKATAVQS